MPTEIQGYGLTIRFYPDKVTVSEADQLIVESSLTPALANEARKANWPKGRKRFTPEIRFVGKVLELLSHLPELENYL